MGCARIRPVWLLSLVALLGLVACDDTPQALPTEGQIGAIVQLDHDSDKVIAELTANEAVFDRPEDEPLTPDERDTLLPLWASLIDHFLAFESFKGAFLYHWENAPGEPEGPVMCLTVGLNAHTAQMAEALELLSRLNGNDALRSALNEASPEYGISAGMVDRIAAEVVAPQSFMVLDIGEKQLERRSDKLFSSGSAVDADLRTSIANTFEAIRAVDRLYNRNGTDLARGIATVIAFSQFDRVLAPIVKDIAAWLGDTQVRSRGKSLITEADLADLLPKMAPGDIILERRNWYLSNLGLPGFWPHTAFFIGSPQELSEAFDADPDVLAAYPDGFTRHLAETWPNAWASYVAGEDEAQPHRIIEAVSEGVVFATFEHSCLADYVAVMRPTFPALTRARAIERSFSHWGKPYDFDFDFLTRGELVCSELVYDSYQAPSDEGESLNLALSEVMGRVTLPPNDIVRQFDALVGKPAQQLEFVAFLDGDPASGRARVETEAKLRASWRRAKWDLSQ